jgi:TPR repeat protein
VKTDFKKELSSKAAVFFTTFLWLLLTGCISVSNFQAWDGPAEFEGQGGAFTTKDGIDIYSVGTPKRKCRIIGVIGTSTMSSAEMMALFGNSWSASKLVKEAKARGGNAVILASDRTQFLGWVSGGTATAYQNGNTATAYGSSYTTANVSRDQVAVLVKYVFDSTSIPETKQTIDLNVQQVTAFPTGSNALTAYSARELEEIRAKAEKGDATAQFLVGRQYASGVGVSQDSVEAVKWYLKSAEQGNAVAQFYLGACYDFATGVAKDYSEARKWYLKAADQGSAWAQFNIGCLYLYGEGVTEDNVEAVKWYRKAAEQGLAAAQKNLGTCYANGNGVPLDYVEAAKWSRLAADQGDAQAQYNVGLCYSNGHGVAQDYTEAVKWYRKAANQGYATAQYNIGVCCRDGTGAAQDYSEAVRWFRKAAEQGDAPAQNNLGACYTSGIGVIKDYVQAYKWDNLAAAQGVKIASQFLSTLEQSMTPEQIAEGQRLVREFKSHKATE